MKQIVNDLIEKGKYEESIPVYKMFCANCGYFKRSNERLNNKKCPKCSSRISHYGGEDYITKINYIEIIKPIIYWIFVTLFIGLVLYLIFITLAWAYRTLSSLVSFLFNIF